MNRKAVYWSDDGGWAELDKEISCRTGLCKVVQNNQKGSGRIETRGTCNKD